MKKTFALELYLNCLREEMLLADYDVPPAALSGAVEYLSYDSKDVRPGTLFVCKGAHFSPKYLADAQRAGAFCYVSQEKYQGNGIEGPWIMVKDIRLAMAALANLFYEEPWKRFALTGITGTKGKSTTAYFVRSILDAYLEERGKPLSGIISSIDTYDGVMSFESHLTTPEAMMLQRHFFHAAEKGLEYVTMEVSSQALKYHRVKGVTFDIGCFLNIGEDHISDTEHRDFDDYFESKLMLFSQCKTACINLDSSHIDEILLAAEDCRRIITFGKQEEAEVYGHHIVKKHGYTSFMVRTPEFEREFHLEIPGLFNVDNALAAIAICSELQIPPSCMYEGLRRARVKGRMEIYENKDRKITVIVDYAHNRMSFETLFDSTLREYPKSSIFAVFGCPGGKAQDRREELGTVAGRYAKKVFITEEDPGEEPLSAISREIAGHVKAQGCAYSIVDDREEAIERAIAEAPENTVILLTGKGRETRQKRGMAYVECVSDVELVEKYLLQK